MEKNKIIQAIAIGFGIFILIGIVFAVSGYVLTKLATIVGGIDCPVEELISGGCEDAIIQPIVNVINFINNLFVPLTYIIFFAIIIALGIYTYIYGKSAIFLVVLFFILCALVYISILLSNGYIGLIENEFIADLFSEYVFYDFIMKYLPRIFAGVGVILISLTVMNLIRPSTNQNIGEFQ
ncbi:MAG: hypothetical protein IMZ60_02770 [Actinobacteria bacterium]|nr:hypothetical protein [Actinomycetota bacterium]